jgi:hypothetical protein
MDNPEKLASLGTQDTVRRQTKQNKNRSTMRKQKQFNMLKITYTDTK